jgi:hypothetical protein
MNLIRYFPFLSARDFPRVESGDLPLAAIRLVTYHLSCVSPDGSLQALSLDSQDSTFSRPPHGVSIARKISHAEVKSAFRMPGASGKERR